RGSSTCFASRSSAAISPKASRARCRRSLAKCQVSVEIRAARGAIVPELFDVTLCLISETADRFADARLTSPSSMKRALLAIPPPTAALREGGALFGDWRQRNYFA